jgi:signal transduction histidine kinase/CheY-like chemotaxis protein
MAKAKKSEADELLSARKEIVSLKKEKEKLVFALAISRKELATQKVEKGKRAAELGLANIELAFQDDEKGKRAAELGIANEEKGKRAAELGIANKEKGKRAAELGIANKEKGKRAAELGIANKELVIQAEEKAFQKRISIELHEAKIAAELATEVAEEAKSKAESATRIAEDAVKAKQQFLSNMSHEIRTPMNAIIGFTKVVLKTDLTAKQKEYLTAIKMSGDALIVLINDILDLAKVDAGKMTFEQTPFKMASSISAMLHIFETKIQEKNLELVNEYDRNIPEVLVGDPVRLHQIILNLVSNAVKFTTIGKISVHSQLVLQDDETVTIEFSVTDTGIGIPEKRIDKIFENFQQATSGTSRLYGGTGLGLAIVKQLVEAQHGSIQVKSNIGEGSTFSFRLSFLKTKAQAEAEIGLVEPDPEIKNIKVLVVEDIALNQLLMKTLLDDFGFERDIADNGRIAIEKLQAKSYDIILMDLQMPEMNGFETTEYIRKKMHSKIPIIALTADVTTVDLAKCKAVGMNDYIAKPVDERLLYTKIVGLVKKPTFIKLATNGKTNGQIQKAKCIDMAYIVRLTKSNPTLMMEMITLYLQQTPTLISAMKQGLRDKDWQALHAAAHKIIPSFSVVGLSVDFENMARKIQEYASTQQQSNGIPDLVLQLENICAQACKELEEEFNTIKNTTA